MDWAPLRHKRGKDTQQSAAWKKPPAYVPYTTSVPLLKLKMIGLKLQKYSNGPLWKLKHRIDRAWWEVITSATSIYEWLGPA